MKQFIIFIMCFIPINVFGISASSVTLMDMDNNRVLYSYNEHEPRLIASISKIMTSLVAINNSDISKMVTISDSVLKSHGSGIYVSVGEKIILEDLLYGLMLRSGNDAAIQIANTVGGSMEGFVLLMNDTAESIGMKKTTFVNSSGLEENNGEGNISTSYDMALLMSEAMKNETFKKIVSTKKHTVKTNYKTYLWYNKNKLLNEYEYTTGGKTGFTKKAKRTLVTTASKDNMNFVIVTLNDPNDFSDHKAIYEEYFKKYQNYKVLDNKKEDLNNKNYYIKNSKNITLTNKEYKNLKKEITLYKKNISNIVGEIKVFLNNDILAKEYIYEKIDSKKNTKKSSLWNKIIRFFNINNN